MGYYEEPEEKENRPDADSEEYAFLQETFKDEKHPGGMKRSTVIRYAILGLVFGLAASLGFFAVKPWAERLVQDDPEQVTIPEEETEEEEVTEEVTETPALTLDNYREMNQALYDVGSEASKCIVEMYGVKPEDDWQESDYDKSGSVSGIIVADNGVEYLIFASSSIAKDAESIQATFIDDRTYEAQLKQKDENLGYAVYAVTKSGMSDATKAKISVAVLGTSGSMTQGDTIIALGSPFGYAGAMGFGVVASPKNSKQNPDGDYGLICTDITGAKNGTGALVNINGEVVGIIDQSISDEDSMNLVTGYGISDLKKEIELLSNGEQVPYLGIIGMTITEEIAEEQGLPEGIYVQEVRADSPAMAAGIQSGDVIVGIGKNEVATVSAYHTQLLKLEVGSSVTFHGMRKGTEGYVDVDYDVTVGSCE